MPKGPHMSRRFLRTGLRVRFIRRKLKLSQAELARRAGLEVRTLRRFEEGCWSVTLWTFVRVLHALWKAHNERRPGGITMERLAGRLLSVKRNKERRPDHGA